MGRVVAIDIGGTTIKSAVAVRPSTLASTTISDVRRTPTPVGNATALTDAVIALVRSYGDDVDAVGVVMPGLLDVPNGRVRIAGNLRLADAPIVEPLLSTLRLPIAFDHDVRAGALAELHAGAARGPAFGRSLVCIRRRCGGHGGHSGAGLEYKRERDMGERSNGTVNMGLVAMIVAVATVGGFMFGYDSGVINGTQKGLEAAFDLGKVGIGINVGAILVGSSVGAFGAGRLADRIGRRGVMKLAAVLFLASAVLAGAAGSSLVFIVARIIGGLGVGAASVISPVYISEVVPAHVRGRLSSVQQVMIITGLTGAFVVNYILAQVAGESTAILWAGQPAWRWMFWLQAVPALVYFVALQFIPESPRYLVAQGDEAGAQAVLARLFDAGTAARTVAEIRDSLAADHHRPRLSDLVDKASGRIRPIVWTGIGLAVFQQLVGINVVFYYGATLWQAVGFSESYALQINIISGLV